MTSRRPRGVTSAVAVIAVATCVLLFGSLRRPTEIPIEPPRVPVASTAAVADLFSTVNVGLELEQDAIRDAIDAAVPRSFSGREDDPIAAASDDSLVWSLDIGAATVGSVGGALAFRIPIERGIVTVTGRLGARGDGRGPLGWLEKFAGIDIDQSVSFDGAVTGTLRPRLNADWTLDPGLRTDVSLSQADAALFGGILTISLRSAISARIDAQVRDQVERLRARLAEDGRIVSVVQRVWDAMHVVVPLSREPPVWLSWQPVALAASGVLADEERVSITLGTTVRVAIDVTETEPALAKGALPAPVTPSPDGNIALRIPVTLRLDAYGAVAPDRLGLRDRIAHARATIAIESITIHGVADELTVAASVVVGRAWRADVRATLYVTGTPALDPKSNRLRLENARFDANTRDALSRDAPVLLEPAILREIERRSVFAILETESELLARARAELALIEASMPAWADTRLQIDSGRISSVVAEDGWLVAVLDVTGRASIRVARLTGLFGEPP